MSLAGSLGIHRHLPRSCGDLGPFSLTRLATLTMQLGDPREAVDLEIRAAMQASQIDSRRIRDEQQRLIAASSRHRRMRDVVELHEVIPARSAKNPTR